MKTKLIYLLLLVTSLTASLRTRAAEVDLSWQDNSTNESGFEVWRAIGNGSFLFLSQVGMNITTFVDSKVTPLVSYSYKIRAFNSAGYSVFSNTATVTIPAQENPPNGAPSALIVQIPGRLANVSNRGQVTIGDSTMIPGFVIVDGPVTVLIRAVGPTIGVSPYSVPGVCPDPKFEVKNAAGITVAQNDNWSGQMIIDAATKVGAFPLPLGSKDAAVLITLPAGAYTVVVTGVADATGVALAEVYEVK